MNCSPSPDCKKATQSIPSCGTGTLRWNDTGLATEAVTLRISKPTGALLDVALTTAADGSLDFAPGADLPAGNEDLLNGFSGLVAFTILDSNLEAVTVTDTNGNTAACTLVGFVEGDGTWAGTVVLEFE